MAGYIAICNHVVQAAHFKTNMLMQINEISWYYGVAHLALSLLSGTKSRLYLELKNSQVSQRVLKLGWCLSESICGTLALELAQLLIKLLFKHL